MAATERMTDPRGQWTLARAWLPCRTISGRWVWLKNIYHRRVWIYTGFVPEPMDQHADLLDILGYTYLDD